VEIQSTISQYEPSQILMENQNQNMTESECLLHPLNFSVRSWENVHKVIWHHHYKINWYIFEQLGFTHFTVSYASD
jgi:hypothetical protein